MNKVTEEYLEAIFSLTGNGKHATTGEISKRLNVTPASVSEMLKKLARDGYVSYSPYRGVELTENGKKVGRRMARRHRLVERFLYDVLKIGKERVHDYACEMEHATPEEVERSMCQVLNQPELCPDDGQDIPPCDFNFSDCMECSSGQPDKTPKIEHRKSEIVSLKELRENERGRVTFIRGGHRLVQRLMDLGITSGAEVEVIRAAKLGGPVQVEVRGSCLALGGNIAGRIFVNRSGLAGK